MKNALHMKRLFVIAALCSSFSTARPIHKNTARTGAIIGGIATGAIAGFITNQALKSGQVDGATRTLVSLLSSGAFGVGGWLLLDYILQQYTPEGKIKYAENIISDLDNDFLLNRNVHAGSIDISSVNVCFSGSWPLVRARNHLTTLNDKLVSAYKNLISAYNEAQSSPSDYPGVAQRCKALLGRLPQLEKTIKNLTNFVISHPDFNFQSNLYEKHLEAQRQRAHEQNMQFSQQLHDSSERQNDRHHDRVERHKDRTHTSVEKDLDRWHTSYENEKDRDFKREVLRDNEYRPITLNI